MVHQFSTVGNIGRASINLMMEKLFTPAGSIGV